MADEAGRFDWVLAAAKVAFGATVVIAGVAFLVTAAVGVFAVVRSGTVTVGLPYALGAMCAAALGIWAAVMYGLVGVIVSNEDAVAAVARRMANLESMMTDQTEATRSLVDLAKLSDQAKSLVFREGELEAFREAINTALTSQDYGAAEKLIDRIETEFGYAEEASHLRTEVEATQKATLEERIDGAISRVMKAAERLDWARAMREARRIAQRYPNNPKVVALLERIQTARMQRKRDLLQQYGEAVRKNDVDLSIQMLKELDPYLTPQEAAALADSARGVFRAKLHNLGVQFAIRVTEEQWAEAVAVGEEIVREYPNSRMAQEVREKLSTLRTRAAQQSAQRRQAKEA